MPTFVDRFVRACGAGIVVALVLGVAIHALWYHAVPSTVLEEFHRRVFPGAFSGEWSHPEVPHDVDLPIWSVPPAFLAGVAASVLLRAGTALSAFTGAILVLILHFVVQPAQYGPSAHGIHFMWMAAGALGGACPPVWRNILERRRPSKIV
jgi:hypothetical protein